MLRPRTWNLGLLARLVEQLRDHPCERVRLEVRGADGQEADAATSVNEHGGRYRVDAVGVSRLRVVRDAEAVRDALLALELPEVFQLLGARHVAPLDAALELRESEDDQPAVFVLATQGVDPWDGVAARAAPRRPEV